MPQVHIDYTVASNLMLYSHGYSSVHTYWSKTYSSLCSWDNRQYIVGLHLGSLSGGWHFPVYWGGGGWICILLSVLTSDVLKREA